MLEEVRLLSNLETPTSKLLQIMLVGQPELGDKLDRSDLRQLRQRIVLRHHLTPFGPEELDQYLDERLRLAGYTGKGIFKRSARKELMAVTGGVPRLVNIVCDSAMLTGYSRGQQSLGLDVIHEAAVELRLVRSEPESAAAPAGAPEAERAAASAAGRKRRWFGLFG
jgi:general secretion pathway protein A